jgi:hypothetical protein
MGTLDSTLDNLWVKLTTSPNNVQRSQTSARTADSGFARNYPIAVFGPRFDRSQKLGVRKSGSAERLSQLQGPALGRQNVKTAR